MRNMLLIARREYLEQIRGRAFRMSTILAAGVLFAVAGRQWVTSAEPRASAASTLPSRPTIAALAERDSQHSCLSDKEAKLQGRSGCAGHGRRTAPSLISAVQTKAIDGLLWIEASDRRDLPTAPIPRILGRLHDRRRSEGLR